jgi:CHAT domain-containing protein
MQKGASMLFPFRAALSLVILTLTLITSAFAQSYSSTSTPASVADEAVLRALTEQYRQAMAAGDLAAMRKFWRPESTNMAAHFKYYKNWFAHSRIEFVRPEVTRLEVTGDKAVTHLTSDESRFDKKTGAKMLTYDPFLGSCHAFEWTRTSGGWQLEREFLVQDELATQLEAAKSVQERDQILEKEKRFVNVTLVGALGTKALRHTTWTEYETAMRYVELQQLVAERINSQVGFAGAFLNAGRVKHAQEEHEEGLALTLKALAIYESIGLKNGMALALENSSNFYRALGDYRRAFDCAQKSLRIAESEQHRRNIMFALTELGIIYGHQNNAEQALAHYERAHAIALEMGETLVSATIRHDIALQYVRFGEYERALGAYQQLLKQLENHGDQGGAAMIRDQIGTTLAEQKKYDEALVYHQQALAGLEAANKKRATVVSLNNMATVYLLQHKYADALSVAERAVAISRDKGRKNDLSFALTQLGYSQLGLNRLSEARQSFTDAVAMVENMRAQTAGGVQEQQRYFEEGLKAHHGLLSVLVKQNETREALTFAERAKARALLDIVQQESVRVLKAMTAQEQDEERRLKSEITQLNRQLARVTHPDKQDATRVAEIETRLEKARLAYEAFQNTLYTTHPELRTQRGEAPIVTANELAELLPDTQTVLLEYVVTEDNTYLFTIAKAGEKAEAAVQIYTVPIKREDLAKQIETFRKQLATRDLGFRPAALKLYDLLLKPVEAQLRGKTSFIIAPDSNLWDLPFQALMNGSGRYLIEDASISYAPSLTVLREMTKRRKNKISSPAPATLLALGNPVSGRETGNHAGPRLRNRNLDPLPEAEQEVKALGRLYGAAHSKIYIGAEAREDRLKSEASKARILHFTTHGTLNNASPMYSYLTLAEGGANDDGLLEAWELMQLDLKADLAVLSACETARGRIGAGEGMIGFSWAMFIAGVPSIVVSQWKVESAGTRDLMVSFHRSLIGAAKTKPTKTDALRQAALALMKNSETRHPFYWAGFVLVGDGR